MRSLLLAPLVAAIALTACKNDTVVAENESAEAVAEKVAESDIRMKPGRWEATMKMDKMEIPNLPPQAKAMMDKQIGVTQTQASCLTPEQAERPAADFFQAGASGCKYDSFVMAGGKLDAAMVCTERGAEVKIDMTGTYSETNYALTMNMAGEAQPGMPMSTQMTIAARNVGECTGSEEK
jgi:Asp-tRNA(Asn)/Glu-tRNA(Gln) amidotransferase B subunit